MMSTPPDLYKSVCIKCHTQRAKKVMSDSPDIVDFAVGLVIFVLNLLDRRAVLL